MQRTLQLLQSSKEEEEESSAPNKKKPTAADGNGGDSLASRLNKMSLEDRSQGLHDLHGVADLEQETPDMLQAKLKELNICLSNIASSLRLEEEVDSSAYYRAVELSPQYVETLKLQCLRADLYKPRDAAMRVIRFFDHKRQLFGSSDDERLVREIHFEDLDAEAQDALEKGFVQLLPHRDRAGRMIMFVYGKLNAHYPLDSVLRALFYMKVMAVSHDEECQRKGFVMIFYGIGQTVNPARSKAITKYRMARPLRYAAIHVWDHMNIYQRIMAPVLSKMLESTSLIRLRFHSATHLEVMYNLLTFGIPRDALPITMDGGMDLTNHIAFIKSTKEREAKEREAAAAAAQTNNNNNNSSSSSDQQQQQAPKILIPGPMDIIMGTRGRHPKSAPGNLRLHTILHDCRDAYDQAPKYEKVVIVEIVRKRANDCGCRFLKATDDGFFTLGDSEAIREKIAHAFRNLRRGKKGRNKAPNNNNNINNNNTNNHNNNGRRTTATTKRSLGS